MTKGREGGEETKEIAGGQIILVLQALYGHWLLLSMRQCFEKMNNMTQFIFSKDLTRCCFIIDFREQRQKQKQQIGGFWNNPGKMQTQVWNRMKGERV